MCFTYEPDWYASVSDQAILICQESLNALKCAECYDIINVGEAYHHIEQQEHEECQACGDGDCDCSADEYGECLGCECEAPSLGESFEMDWCQNCENLLRAIEEIEKEEGCPPHSRRPAMPGLFDELWEVKENVPGYIAKMLSMFPEMAGTSYLERIKERFQDDED